MKYLATPLAGAWQLEPEPKWDERGFFARSWCRQEFAERGLDPRLVQCNISYNARRGTLRGLHYQRKPYPEAKLVRCTRGALYDVIVDIRPQSDTYLRWHGVELTAENYRMLYIPAGFAHGFQTLCDETEVFYQMSETYHPGHSSGLNWLHPALAIDWPILPPIISERDQALPLGEPLP